MDAKPLLLHCTDSLLNWDLDLQLQAVGSSANVLLHDIPACGPSLINTVDAVLLPA